MDSDSKIKHSKRLQQKQNHIIKETKIAKSHNVPVTDPHRLAKKSPMNCGNPKCHMCANPRKSFKEMTIQERKHYQNLDEVRDRHSNGLEHLEWDNWKPIE